MATLADTQTSCAPWIPPAQPLIPCTWLKTGSCEIIRALNANGSPVHSLFSPGSRVPERAEGPMSDCSERTNLRLPAVKPSALFSPAPPLSPCSRRTPRRSLERNPACACDRWVWGQSEGRWWRRAGVSGRERLFPRRTALQGLMRAAEGGMWQQEGGGRWSDPQINTWPEPDRADMGACPHLCSGKATPGARGRQTQIEFQQCT